MFRCLGGCARTRSQSHSPANRTPPPNLPENMLREMLSHASPRTRRRFAQATTRNFYTRRTLPIGLQVTKVGPSQFPSHTPRVINRSRAVAKASPLRLSGDSIDRINPAAYKNNTWRFYRVWNRNHILFTNTRNGNPFILDKRTGARKPVPARLGIANGPLQRLTARKNGFHTWTAYIKRAMRNRRLIAGKGVRNAKYTRINTNVQRLLDGNNRALNRYSVPNLVFWANPTQWMQMNGTPYVKYRGQWARHGSNSVLTKNDIIENIRLQHSLR